MRISLIQMDVAFGDPAVNQRRVAKKLAQVVEREHPDVVALPEMWNAGYDLTRLDRIADRGELVEWMGQKSREYGITLMGGSIAEVKDGGHYNASYVFSPQGDVVAQYRKLHLFRLMEEEKFLLPGPEGPVTFPIGGYRAGMIICYDVRFPEMVRSLALEGAELLFVSAEWPHPRLNHWRILNQARAIENQMAVAAINRVGSDPNNTFCGHSMVLDPWGKVLAEGGEGEETLTVDLELAEVARIRRQIPVFEDRVPHMYRIGVSP
ncbi:carbon-nitrogen family hydrolase [Desmospora profundinema]|uniref:Amidohydrolase n=1 Tax=Desmospora profundinema TaxID=1571184 RepID=A0ABU1IIX9_9BACL|nr:carbon-nitrogen family hydrolase [Desmospora profundinema]MDR6224720.1 putative amidohydrolase [Desmospora profundinema]